MHGKKLLSLAGVLIVGYVAFPYYTLYRLGHAIRTGDAATVRSLVDWDSVREGIKEDVCDDMAEASASAHATPAAASGHDTLPAFGSSFIQGIASSEIDAAINPAALVSAARAMRPAAAAHAVSATPHVQWAFFDGPTRFNVLLTAPGLAQAPIRLQMSLVGERWIVTRATLPPAMLIHAGERT